MMAETLLFAPFCGLLHKITARHLQKQKSMATTKYYLDTRAAKNTAAPLKLMISHKGKTAMYSVSLYVFPNQWNAQLGQVVAIKNQKAINHSLAQFKMKADQLLFELATSGRLPKMTAINIRDMLAPMEDAREESEKLLFLPRLRKFCALKKEGTQRLYRETEKRICDFAENAEKLSFADINHDWLVRFNNFMALNSPSQNARNINLRNIRAVFNDALADELAIPYPFRRFKIKNVETAKRALSVENLRKYFNAPTDETSERYLDIFKLIFFLMGINIVDLCHLKSIEDGCIEYHRAKTGRLYRIKVEPEAMELIKKHRGKKWLLNILDKNADYRSFYRHLDANLKKIGDFKVGKRGKKTVYPYFPKISTYWARHTWATIAASLDIPKETIAAALGHGGRTVTDIYIDFDKKKVEAANRRVMDWVLYER